ncbi:MAG: DUF5694 domain-containing protein [Terracidiphilus sp.]|nr:DUF5694 domain-containing protein [Terracidiphilus sp.]
MQLQTRALRLLPYSIVFLLIAAIPLLAQSKFKPVDASSATPQAEVLLLGTYHMNNPGRDIHNMKADDVLTPQRQAEIEELTTVLARFRPTKIAIEWDAGDQTGLDRVYGEYVAGQRQLSRDERQQVGMRLAKHMNLKKIYAINTMWDFPYGSVINWAKANGRSAEIEALDRIGSEQSKADGEYLLSHTVLDMYRRLNSPASISANAATYARLGHFGDDSDPAGARLLTRWYERNTFILISLLGVVEPGDRVFVLYGAGHQTLLHRFIADDPTLKLRTLDELLANSK